MLLDKYNDTFGDNAQVFARLKLGPKYGLGETSKEEAEAREAVTS